MNRSPDTRTDAELDATLRSLDAAQTTLTPAQHARADALLRSLTTNGHARPDALASVSPITEAPRRRRRTARWLVPVAAASALVVGALIWPGSPAAPSAYADWTPEPSPVTGTLLSKATDSCRASLSDMERRSAPGEDAPLVNPASARVVLAEQRGAHVFLHMVTDTGAEVVCLSDAGSNTTTSMSGSAPAATTPAPTVEPDGLTGGGVGLSLEGTSGYGYTYGLAGAQVRRVTIHSAGKSVEATVKDGRYVAWWPVEGMEPRSSGLVDARLDVTLADGTTRTDVETDLSRGLGPRPGPTEVGRVGYGGGVSSSGEVKTIEGLVGDRVTGVTVHLDGADHEAVVANGTFFAEWPVADSTVGPFEGATFTLTLDDGTVLEGVTEAG